MLHYPKQNGFVLLIVLCLMQILVLLNWYGLENLLSVKRFSQNMLAHETLYRQGVTILAGIEQSIVMEMPECVLSIIDPETLLIKPVAWWETGSSCVGNFQGVKYYYIVEFLAIDSCAVIESVHAIAAYVRVTLFLLKNNQHLMLQSTVIRPVIEKAQVCNGLLHTVEAGRQSWRELKEV